MYYNVKKAVLKGKKKTYNRRKYKEVSFEVLNYFKETDWEAAFQTQDIEQCCNILWNQQQEGREVCVSCKEQEEEEQKKIIGPGGVQKQGNTRTDYGRDIGNTGVVLQLKDSKPEITTSWQKGEEQVKYERNIGDKSKEHHTRIYEGQTDSNGPNKHIKKQWK